MRHPLLAQRVNLDRFFRASKEGVYEAVRTLLEELQRKTLSSSFTLHVTLAQTTITTTKTISSDSLLTGDPWNPQTQRLECGIQFTNISRPSPRSVPQLTRPALLS